MKKKIFGIQISTIVQFVFCLVLAFAIWISVQYNNSTENDKENADPDTAEITCVVDPSPEV